MSVDTGLIVEALRARGHAVGHTIPVPENAGEFEFEVDGELLTLDEARALMEDDDARLNATAGDETVVAVGEAIVVEEIAPDVLVVESVPVVVTEEK